MKIINVKVEDNSIEIEDKYITSGTYNYIKCHFLFSEEWDEYDKIAVFSFENKAYKKAIINDEVIVPKEVAEHVGRIYVGVYGNKLVEDILESRCTTDLDSFKIVKGSYDENANEDEELVDISIYDTYIATMNAILEEVNQKHKEVMASGGSTSGGTTGGGIGVNGKDGRGIVSIQKTEETGLVDTYTITYTDDTTSTFEVTNGTTPVKGIDYFTDEDKEEFKTDVIEEITPTLNEKITKETAEFKTETEIQKMINTSISKIVDGNEVAY